MSAHTAVDRIVAAEHALERVIELPRLAVMLRTSGPQLLVTSVIPLVLFYVVFRTAGLGWALLAGLGWSYSTLLRYIVRRRPIPGMLLVSTALLSLRALLAFLTGSVVVYFLQPTCTQLLMAVSFAVTAMWRRPLISRLAGDFCAIPEALTGDRALTHFFRTASWLWSGVFCAISAGTLALLLTQPTGMYLVCSSAVTVSLVLTGIGLSFVLFRRALRGENIRLCWAAAEPA